MASVNFLYVVLVLAGAALLWWASQLVLLYLQIKWHESFWRRWNCILPAPDAIKYVALGDSTAVGIGGGAPDHSYPFLVKRWAESQYGRPVSLINLGASGAKVGDCLVSQIPELRELRPDIVTIEIGANDIKSFDATVFKHQFMKLVSLLPKGAFVSDIPAFTGRSKRLNAVVVKANRIIISCLKDAALTHVKLYEATKVHKGLWYFAADYFHPNARAYKNWAAAFTNAMPETLHKK